MIDFLVPGLVVAFVLTIIEMTEVVALVFALGADHSTLRHGVMGAITGTAVVGLVALGAGALLVGFPRTYLLWAAAIVLAGFGVFLYRSTLRSYRRARTATPGAPAPGRPTLQFAGGFTVGAVETTEVVVVLLALTAAGEGAAAVVGALAGGALLVGAALLVHERIRRIKVPLLKLGGTSMLFAFAVFWAGEAGGLSWPLADGFLAVLFVVSLVLVRGSLQIVLRRVPSPVVAT